VAKVTAGEALIRIVAAVAVDADGRTLLVRKRGTSAFMQPGGKLDEGEAPIEALERELREELGCGLERESCRALGVFRAPAANERGFVVEAELFVASLVGDPRPLAEIDELVWIDPDQEVPYRLAPLTRQHALPLARELKSKARNSCQ
jgi:8-oxo-dGTP pyrophosphatase MutT (NUDIX family)